MRFGWLLLALLALVVAPADSQAQIGAQIIHVCVRVRPDVDRWIYTDSGELITGDSMQFAALAAGRRVFVYSPTANSDSPKQLPKEHSHLGCPDRVVTPSSTLPFTPDVKPQDLPQQTRLELGMCRPSLPNASSVSLPKVELKPGQKTPMTAACGHCKPEAAGGVPKKGSSSGSSTQPWTASEYTRSEIAIAIAMLSLNFNVELPADGSKDGIVGGMNPDGFDLPAAQVVAMAVILGLEVVTFTGKFDKMLKKAIAKGKRLFIKESSVASRQIARELAAKHGLEIADGIRANGTIMPYELAQKFTHDLGHRLHAHHLVEVKWFGMWRELGDSNLAPSVILTEEYHKLLHAKMAKVKLPTGPEDLLRYYEKVYESHPEWIQAVKWFLKK